MIAAYETEVRGERVKAGQEADREKGRRWGSSRKGVRKKKVAEKAETVLMLAEQGVAKMQIAKVLGISVPTVYSILGGSRVERESLGKGIGFSKSAEIKLLIVASPPPKLL
jgi:DNA invertase Pin-like site-specific DNA recombinase